MEILRGISLDIPAGQFLAILGASGSGKSTLLGLLAGLDTPSEGEIWLDGVPIHNLAEGDLAAVRGRKIGFVFQSYQLIQTLTALENVLLPYELNVEGSGLAQARQLLGEVGLGERMDHYPVQLSGGEQQRVALARAFVIAPPIVMADEPTGNLDSVNGKMVLDLLLERNRKAGTTLVLVTHDPEIASRADRKIVLRDGLVVEDTLVQNQERQMAKRALRWNRAAAIGWRDLKSAPGKFGFVVLSVAVGVAALVGVRGLSDSFRQTLNTEARSLLAGDLSARMFRAPTPEESAKIAAIADQKSGIRSTWVIETVSMASVPPNPAPILVSLKAVDPAEYPFYGTAVLEPSMPLAQALQGDSAVVSDEFLIRLNAHVGDTLRLGGRDFRITAVLEQEPDRISETVGMGPRVMISQASLTEHAVAGSRQPRLAAPAAQAARYAAARPDRQRASRRGAQAIGSGAARRAGDGLPRRQPRAYARPR